MIKNFRTKLIALVLFIFTILVLCNPTLLINSVNYSTNLFIKNIFPTLFPFFILSEILINYKVTYYIGKILKIPFKYLFNLNGESAFVVILSMLSGHPSNAKYTKELLDNNIISKEEATRIITTTFFPSPMFILGTIGTMFYNNMNAGLIILLTVYITNFLIGFITRNKLNNSFFNKPLNNNKILSIGEVIKKSTLNAFNTLFVILGSITIFVIITNVLFTYTNFNQFIDTLISAFLEITTGTKKISILNTSINLKLILTNAILSFGGLSVHFQIMSIINECKINYNFIFKYRIIASLLSIIISIFLISIIPL